MVSNPICLWRGTPAPRGIARLIGVECIFLGEDLGRRKRGDDARALEHAARDLTAHDHLFHERAITQAERVCERCCMVPPESGVREIGTWR